MESRISRTQSAMLAAKAGLRLSGTPCLTRKTALRTPIAPLAAKARHASHAPGTHFAAPLLLLAEAGAKAGARTFALLAARAKAWAAGALSLALLASSPAHAAELTVSAAASLGNAFTAIASGFTQSTGIKVHLNFASSNNLLRQMQSGAPVDVFASADEKSMDMAAGGGLIVPETRRDFAKTDIVLITPIAGRPALGVEGLHGEGFARIAIGSPASVPAGRYAQESLASAGLWEELSPKFVFGNNVRQVLSYVQQGEADAGIVYRTDALSALDKVRIDAVLEGHTPVTYPIAITADSAAPQEARRFLEYVLSAEGEKVLADFGFGKAE